MIKKIPPIEATSHTDHLVNGKGFPGDAFECLHVGVVVDSSPEEVSVGGLPIWIVADAGQGPQHGQQALYDRPVLGADAKGFPTRSGRRLAGYVNIDNYVPWPSP